MGIFTNSGVNIDVNNIRVKQYLEGKPNINKWYKEHFLPFVETLYNKKWTETSRESFKKDLWDLVSEGLNEGMFDSTGTIDPYVKEIIDVKVNSYIRGWNTRNRFFSNK